jgi:hypothetical protein
VVHPLSQAHNQAVAEENPWGLAHIQIVLAVHLLSQAHNQAVAEENPRGLARIQVVLAVHPLSQDHSHSVQRRLQQALPEDVRNQIGHRLICLCCQHLHVNQ